MTTEIEPVRSNSPELSAMTLPKLKTVATQLGVEGAAKMKKDALVEAIADLQAKKQPRLQRLNAKHVVKRAIIERRKASLPTTLMILSTMEMMIQPHKVMIAMIEVDVLTVMIVMVATVTAIAIEEAAKNASRSSAKMMFSFP
jgi:acylphosphatase